jgi:ABC-type bacteriocin/lantibiotic exporter with double-glycine peptidase domain
LRANLRYVAGRSLLCCGLLVSIARAQRGAGWLDVPFVKQEKNGCGAAAIAMLMRYWAREDADPRRIQQALYSPDVRGIRGSEVERYFREHNFRVFTFQGEWADLEQHLAKGRPLLVCLTEGRGSALHYVVVAGVDAAQNLVLINDPARRKLRKVERGSFEKGWRATNYWTLLAVPQAGG